MNDLVAALPQNSSLDTASSFCTTIGLIPAGEMSAILQVSTQTLATWRCKKRGPPSIKLGKRVFYLLADFNKWMLDEVQEQRAPLRQAATPGTAPTSKPQPASSDALHADAG